MAYPLNSVAVVADFVAMTQNLITKDVIRQFDQLVQDTLPIMEEVHEIMMANSPLAKSRMVRGDLKKVLETGAAMEVFVKRVKSRKIVRRLLTADPDIKTMTRYQELLMKHVSDVKANLNFARLERQIQALERRENRADARDSPVAVGGIEGENDVEMSSDADVEGTTEEQPENGNSSQGVDEEAVQGLGERVERLTEGMLDDLGNTAQAQSKEAQGECESTPPSTSESPGSDGADSMAEEEGFRESSPVRRATSRGWIQKTTRLFSNSRARPEEVPGCNGTTSSRGMLKWGLLGRPVNARSIAMHSSSSMLSITHLVSTLAAVNSGSFSLVLEDDGVSVGGIEVSVGEGTTTDDGIVGDAEIADNLPLEVSTPAEEWLENGLEMQGASPSPEITASSHTFHKRKGADDYNFPIPTQVTASIARPWDTTSLPTSALKEGDTQPSSSTPLNNIFGTEDTEFTDNFGELRDADEQPPASLMLDPAITRTLDARKTETSPNMRDYEESPQCPHPMVSSEHAQSCYPPDQHQETSYAPIFPNSPSLHDTGIVQQAFRDSAESCYALVQCSRCK